MAMNQNGRPQGGMQRPSGNRPMMQGRSMQGRRPVQGRPMGNRSMQRTNNTSRQPGVLGRLINTSDPIGSISKIVNILKILG